MPDPVKVLVLYDHPLLGEGLGALMASVPELDVERVAMSDPDAMELAIASGADVVILEEGGPVGLVDLLRDGRCRPSSTSASAPRRRGRSAARPSRPTRTPSSTGSSRPAWATADRPPRLRHRRRRPPRQARCPQSSRRRLIGTLTPATRAVAAPTVEGTMSGMPDSTTPPSPRMPIGRRRALAVIGSSVAGVVLLEGCGPGTTPPPRGWIQADVDPDTLELNTPVSVKFAGSIEGTSLAGSACWCCARPASSSPSTPAARMRTVPTS